MRMRCSPAHACAVYLLWISNHSLPDCCKYLSGIHIPGQNSVTLIHGVCSFVFSMCSDLLFLCCSITIRLPFSYACSLHVPSLSAHASFISALSISPRGLRIPILSNPVSYPHPRNNKKDSLTFINLHSCR